LDVSTKTITPAISLHAAAKSNMANLDGTAHIAIATTASLAALSLGNLFPASIPTSTHRLKTPEHKSS
jgi:hypothetical protein